MATNLASEGWSDLKTPEQTSYKDNSELLWMNVIQQAAEDTLSSQNITEPMLEKFSSRTV